MVGYLSEKVGFFGESEPSPQIRAYHAGNHPMTTVGATPGYELKDIHTMGKPNKTHR